MNDDKLLGQDEVDALLKVAQSGKETRESKNETAESSDPPTASPDQGAHLYSEEEAGGAVLKPDGGEQTGTSPVGTNASADAPGAALNQLLNSEEKDALGEIGNISMGSAATTLSQLLNRRVLITSPVVTTTNKKDFLKGFNVPYLVIKVKFKDGFDGYNVLIIKLKDAIVMANLMMGGDGDDLSDDISEMEISAAAEAMNQMIGTASTSLADLLSRSINIMPPETTVVKNTNKLDIDLPFSDPIVVISFQMNIENLLDTNIMQVIDLHTAREQSELLWNRFSGGEEDGAAGFTDQQVDLPADETTGLSAGIQDGEPEIADTTVSEGPPYLQADFKEPGRDGQLPHQTPGNGRSEVPQIDPDKLNLLLDIPLKVSVVLGRTKRQIRDVLQMTPGAIVELDTLVGEPVEILVNGKLVARGEVVVVNENFGVKITNIISARDRLNTLGEQPFN